MLLQIYLELMNRFPYARLSVLNTLTFSTPLTRSLWMWMCAYGVQVSSFLIPLYVF